MWPVMDVKEITSPPKGRKRKNVHEMSMNSDAEAESPYKKRSKSAQSQDVFDDPENKKKVAAFVMNLERKNGNRKFSQTKIKFTSLKESHK